MAEPLPDRGYGGLAADNASTLQRLLAALAVARGGLSFIFAVCASVPLRRKVVEEIVKGVPGTLSVELRSEGDDVFDAAARESGGTTPTVVVISGLDLALLAEHRSGAAVTALNASRELWRGRFPCPVVFILSWASLDRVVRGAPDLWSRKSHLFEFDDERSGEMVAMPPGSGLGIANDVAVWPSARRLARTVELDARLGRSEAAADPFAQRARTDWLMELGHLWLAEGRFNEAREAFARVSERARAGKDWSVFASGAAWESHVMTLLGEPARAAVTLEEALSVVESKAAKDDPSLSTLLSTIGATKQQLGDLAAARGHMHRAIEIDLKHFAADHPTVAASYSNLAMIEKDLGELAAARGHMHRAIEIDLKHFAADHPTLAASYSNLAMLQKEI
ncbi:MAG: tetratricopeptide repeat protein, partial [Phycisphaerales bacterium]